MQIRNVHITVKNVVEKSGLSLEMASRRTFSRCLDEEGYSYLQARKMGLLSENDRKVRLRFAREMKRKVKQIVPLFLARIEGHTLTNGKAILLVKGKVR